MNKAKSLLLTILFICSNSNQKLKSPMIIGDDYEFKIYEHPKCKLNYCLQSLRQDEFENYMVCKIRQEFWVKEKERYGLSEDEALSICMYTYDSKQIANILSKGNEGEYGCFTEYLNSGLNKIWDYSRHYNMSTFSILYTGIGLEDAKRSNFIDGNKCLLKQGDHIFFPSYGSTTASISLAKYFASNPNLRGDNKGGMIFNIKTLKSKTKAILIQRLSLYPEESEYLFPPGSKFEVISPCKTEIILENYKLPQEPLYYVELQEIDEFVNYKTQIINENEDKIKDYTRICTRCNSEVHNFCKYCEKEDKCTECYAGYIPNEKGLCVKCSDNCLKCDSKELNKCTYCFNGYGLIDNKSCQKCSDDNCIKCDHNINICQSCKKGLTLLDGKCEKLDTFCETYDSERKCTKCIGATYLENGICKECNDGNKIQHCASCSKEKDGEITCKNCFPGFMQNYDTCLNDEDETGCEYGINGRCLQCKNYYALNNNYCYECPEGCLKCKFEKEDLNCQECYSGYVLNNQFNCDKCPVGCENCILTNGIETCTSCLPGFILNDGTCDDCLNGCGECDINKKCLHCSMKIEGKSTTLDLNSDTCLTCEEGCERCRFNSGKYICDACSYGYVMKPNGECQKCNDLIENCKGCEYNKNNELKCLKCDSYYNLKNGECKKCQLPECDICEIDDNNNQVCLACSKHILSSYNQYGLKDGKCELCDEKDCLCVLNSKKHTLECQIKKSDCYTKNLLLSNINIFLFLLFIFI